MCTTTIPVTDFDNNVDYYNGVAVTPFIDAIFEWIDDTSQQ
jgi:hypothetical protein